ncbi:hypothetical protein RI129_003769 [Pyrocoelia pectoralis]|uniref:Uncharacterized protein n=1 Tax=Pyrocoelia pectoralis TaxID=417401 RepID=A0AAN7ZND4_9COLE
MICDDDEEPQTEDNSSSNLPDTEKEVTAAKLFMQQCSSFTGDNLYDHLSEVLNKILSERPEDVVDFFEEYSRKVKEKRFKTKIDHLEDMFIPPEQYNRAYKIMPLFKKPDNLPESEEEILADMTRNDMLQLSYFFEQSGLGLPKNEMFALLLSMRKLIKTEPVASIRFWGKILGLYKNYFVLEADLKEEECVRRNEVYYVCNEIGDEWVQLPDVTPRQLRVARQIRKSFTGWLAQEILTYPNFPGNEGNYLRAQIARISAGTQISPLGFYTFKPGGGGGEEEEEEEEEAEGEEGEGPRMKTNCFENRRYEPPPTGDLLDNSMSFWVHHILHILPQGRTSWWNPNPKVDTGEEAEGEEEEDEEKQAAAGPEPEIGPPLLTPLSEDASLDAVPAWSVRISSNILPEYALVVVRSNLWPGAYCFTTQGKIFHNLYIGFGHKHVAQNFTPLPLPFVEQDYLIGPEIMEMTDPTGAEEEQWRIDHLPKLPPAEEGEEEGELEEEEEEY